ncbi:hypothetical protein BpHYR1_042035 [Brachionus plicatilis]|uniref:Uncharacterized protein n=1 Tax=Brachionus plicatilis TaxID=10195 RepID=A0A3M7PT61_BRAPC|nr:hypothetical protein BpHYR1_042035 [Brachionus plicatilis]
MVEKRNFKIIPTRNFPRSLSQLIWLLKLKVTCLFFSINTLIVTMILKGFESMHKIARPVANFGN